MGARKALHINSVAPYLAQTDRENAATSCVAVKGRMKMPPKGGYGGNSGWLSESDAAAGHRYFASFEIAFRKDVRSLK